MTQSPDVIIVGEVQFPERSASAFRTLGNAKALRDAGFSVLFAGMEKGPRPEDLQSDGTYAYQGFPYISGKDFGPGHIARLKRGLLTHATGSTTMQRLHAIDTRSTKVVIAYFSSAMLLWRVMRFCRRRKITLIADLTEWFHPKHVPWGRLGTFYWDAELRTRHMLPKIGNVIAISSFLRDYYQSRGCNAIWVPTLIDPEPRSVREAADLTAIDRAPNELRLVFAGTTFREQWDVILAGILQVRQAGHNVRLDVFGSSRDGFLASVGRSRALAEQLGDTIAVHGRVPRDEYLRGVMQSDFIVMAREISRWSKACFPTKLPELMAMGLPVITNAHSDLGYFIRDGVEGLIVDHPTVPDFVRTLTRAINMPREDVVRMGQHSRDRAVECFDYRRHVTPLKDFVERAIAATARHGTRS